MHKYIMHKISTPEIWLKYKSFLCVSISSFGGWWIELLVSENWKITCGKGKNFKHKYIVWENVNRKDKIEEGKFFWLSSNTKRGCKRMIMIAIRQGCSSLSDAWAGCSDSPWDPLFTPPPWSVPCRRTSTDCITWVSFPVGFPLGSANGRHQPEVRRRD